MKVVIDTNVWVSYLIGSLLLGLDERILLVVSPSKKVDACRDRKDNFLLEVALEEESDYLITGDEDLLVLNPFHGIKIIRPKDFEEILKAKNLNLSAIVPVLHI